MLISQIIIGAQSGMSELEGMPDRTRQRYLQLREEYLQPKSRTAMGQLTRITGEARAIWHNLRKHTRKDTTMEQWQEKIEQNIEHLSEAEKENKFIIRDSSIKITFAQGMADLTYRKMTQLETDMVQLRAEMHELRVSTDHHFEYMRKKFDTQELTAKEQDRRMNAIDDKLDQILQLLQQKSDG